MKPHVTIYTKEQGKIEFTTSDEWFAFDDSNITLHREDGPAIECANGAKEYWLNGKYLSEEEFNKKKRKSMNLFKRTLISILKYLLHKLEKKGD